MAPRVSLLWGASSFGWVKLSTVGDNSPQNVAKDCTHQGEGNEQESEPVLRHRDCLDHD